jgi:general stress protein YciG
MKKRKGFAAMTREQRRRIASLGGKAAQQRGTGHRWTPEEAREAGRKGGQASQAAGVGNRFNSETGRAAAGQRRGRRPQDLDQ